MLIDEYLPTYQVQSRHVAVIDASTDLVFESIRKADLSESLLVKALFFARGLPSSALRLQGLSALGFIELGEIPSQEYLLGIVGQFWKPSGALIRVPAKEFGAFQRDGYVKAAWSFSVQANDSRRSELVTETRVATFGRRAAILFRMYWFVIAPFSGIIRREILRAIKAIAEVEVDYESA